MKHSTFFIRQYSFGNFFHGGIGYADAEDILLKKKFEPLVFPHYNSSSFGAKLSRAVYLLTCLFKVKKNAWVVFLFPPFAFLNSMLIRLLGSRKNIRLICFIADIDGIKDGDDKLLARELSEFKRYNYFIVHNDSMRLWLQSHIPNAAMACIDFFDFIATPFTGTREKSFQVVFAGNLAKSIFLEKLHALTENSPELSFNLYGPGITEKMRLQENVIYRGIEAPAALPAKIEGSFGLVWDGDSIGVLAGSLGNYMRYISHHKLSLYILSGLPLIVPETAASAPLVRKYGIGITVNTLHEIGQKLKLLSAEQYRQMHDNMKPLAQKISRGNCLTEALDKLMENEEV